MSDHTDKTIADLQEKILSHVSKIVQVKKTINQLLDLEAKPPLYTDTDMVVSEQHGVRVIPDEFYGKPLASSVKKILARRKLINLSAASTEEIFHSLTEGGYNPGKNKLIARRNVSITLGKNPAFHRLPNGLWGMSSWYNLQTKKDKNDTKNNVKGTVPEVEKSDESGDPNDQSHEEDEA